MFYYVSFIGLMTRVDILLADMSVQPLVHRVVFQATSGSMSASVGEVNFQNIKYQISNEKLRGGGG